MKKIALLACLAVFIAVLHFNMGCNDTTGKGNKKGKQPETSYEILDSTTKVDDASKLRVSKAIIDFMTNFDMYEIFNGACRTYAKLEVFKSYRTQSDANILLEKCQKEFRALSKEELRQKIINDYEHDPRFFADLLDLKIPKVALIFLENLLKIDSIWENATSKALAVAQLHSLVKSQLSFIENPTEKDDALITIEHLVDYINGWLVGTLSN